MTRWTRHPSRLTEAMEHSIIQWNLRGFQANFEELALLSRRYKLRTNKYILELWQSEWDEFPENKLYKIFPVLKECIVCPRTNKKEETVMARLHIGHSFITHSFLLKGEEPPVCIGCDKRLTIEHILLTCSDFIEKRESHFTAKSLRMLFQDISPDKIFNVLK